MTRHSRIALLQVALILLPTPALCEGFLPPPKPRKIEERLAATLSNAEADGRRALLVFCRKGSPWSDRLMEALTKDPEVLRLLRAGFFAMSIDVADGDASVLARRLGVDVAKLGLPCLAVLDDKGALIAVEETTRFRGETFYEPAKVQAFLRQLTPPELVASNVLGEALAQADAAHKQVFLRLGASWCGWCHQLEKLLHEPAIAEVLDAHYVSVYVDVTKTKGGEEVQARYMPNDEGFPWYALLGADGKTRIDSSSPGGYHGYPADEQDVDAFVGMLNAGTGKRLSEGELSKLRSEILRSNLRRGIVPGKTPEHP